MPNQQTFEGHLAPVAWEALSRGWNARRDEDGNLLIEFEGDECCLCTTAPHAASDSNQALGLGPGEDSFVVVASVPVVAAVPLSPELLEEVRAWSDVRRVPVGTAQVVPVGNPDLPGDAVRVTVDYRVAGFGRRRLDCRHNWPVWRDERRCDAADGCCGRHMVLDASDDCRLFRLCPADGWRWRLDVVQSVRNSK